MSVIYKVTEDGVKEEDKAKLAQAQLVYGTFDLDYWSGKPTKEWEARHIHNLQLFLHSYFFPDFNHRFVQVNQRASRSLSGVYDELRKTFDATEMKQYYLDQFVRCFCFGHGSPSLFWWGGAWELSPKVKGDSLEWAAEIFVKNGWKRTATRIFEFW